MPQSNSAETKKPKKCQIKLYKGSTTVKMYKRCNKTACGNCTQEIKKVSWCANCCTEE